MTRKFQFLLTALLLTVGVTSAWAQTTVTVKNCVTYTDQASPVWTITRDQADSKEVAFTTYNKAVWYLGLIDFKTSGNLGVSAIEVKGLATQKTGSGKYAQLRLAFIPEASITGEVTASVISTNLANIRNTGTNELARITVNTQPTKVAAGKNNCNYVGADFIITHQGVAQTGVYDGTVDITGSTPIMKNDAKYHVFLYNGEANARMAVDEIVFHYKDGNTLSYTMEAGDAEAATLLLPFRADVPDKVKAYTLNYTSGNKVTASEPVAQINPHIPYLINAPKGTYTFISIKNFVADSKQKTSGALVGNYETKEIVPSGSYILTLKDDEVGFRKADGSTNYVNAFRCYLTPEGGEAREFFGIDFGETTSIEGVQKNQQENNVIYNLQGVRVENPTKGIYVKNGRKFVVK